MLPKFTSVLFLKQQSHRDRGEECLPEDRRGDREWQSPTLAPSSLTVPLAIGQTAMAHLMKSTPTPRPGSLGAEACQPAGVAIWARSKG